MKEIILEKITFPADEKITPHFRMIDAARLASYLSSQEQIGKHQEEKIDEIFRTLSAYKERIENLESAREELEKRTNICNHEIESNNCEAHCRICKEPMPTSLPDRPKDFLK